jgi:cytochrome c peroxidase
MIRINLIFTMKLTQARNLSLCLAALVLAACGGGGGTGPGSPATADSNSASSQQLSAAAQVGEQIFSDTTLSVSGKQACSTCHARATGFAANDGRATPLGGPNMDLPGLRNTPTLMYVSFTPTFHVQVDGTPVGGFFRDGRARSLADQARLPFITPFEMANANSAEVLSRLKTRPYFAQFVSVFGPAVAADPDQALTAMGTALAAYQTEDPDFHPFSSKFDAFQRGQAKLTPAEARGFALFIDPTRGDCTACHPAVNPSGGSPLFTDHTYDDIGLPRNWSIVANQAGSTLPYVPANGTALGAPGYKYYDMGLCGPLRTDITTTSLCSNFKVPTLRNVAIRQHYFHNGVFNNLQDVMSWYVTRDTNPTHWYLQQDGVTPDIRFNDTPVAYDANINIVEVPYNPFLAPTLTPAQINDLVVFLCSLTDGYDPAKPSAYNYPAQCQSAAQAASFNQE